MQTFYNITDIFLISNFVNVSSEEEEEKLNFFFDFKSIILLLPSYLTVNLYLYGHSMGCVYREPTNIFFLVLIIIHF